MEKPEVTEVNPFIVTWFTISKLPGGCPGLFLQLPWFCVLERQYLHNIYYELSLKMTLETYIPLAAVTI